MCSLLVWFGFEHFFTFWHYKIAQTHLALFIYFWLGWVFVMACRLSLVEASGDYPLVTAHGLLMVVACLVVEHRLQVLEIQ